MKLIIKTGIALMIVTLSSIEWVLGFVAVMMILLFKLIDLLLQAEDKEMMKIVPPTSKPIIRDDERFKRRMEEF